MAVHTFTTVPSYWFPTQFAQIILPPEYIIQFAVIKYRNRIKSEEAIEETPYENWLINKVACSYRDWVRIGQDYVSIT